MDSYRVRDQTQSHRAILQLHIDSEIATIVNSIMHDTADSLCKVIKIGQDAGIFTSTYPARSLARFVFNSFNGLRVTVKFDSNKKMFDDIVNVCL